MVLRLAGAMSLHRTETDALLVAAGLVPERCSGPRRGDELLIGHEAIAAAEELHGARNAQDAVAIAGRALSRYGVHHFITGRIVRAHGTLRVQRDAVGRPAEDWLRHMARNDYHDRDYLLAVTASRAQPFLWDDVRGDPMTDVQRRILDEARDFGIATGFVLPVHQPDGSVRAFSSWSDGFDDRPVTRIAAGVVAHALLHALDRVAPAA